LTNYTLTCTDTGGSGNSSVTLSPSGGTYASGTVVTLTLVAATGDLFNDWAGADAGSITGTGQSGHPYQITMSKNMVIQAVWAYIEYQLTLVTIHGTITPNPTNSSGMPSGFYHYGQSIVLTVAPLSTDNGAFSRWSDNNTNNPRTITMPASNVTYTAIIKYRLAYYRTFGEIDESGRAYQQSFDSHKPDVVDPTKLSDYQGTWGEMEEGEEPQ
jgi:hypothetical protein